MYFEQIIDGILIVSNLLLLGCFVVLAYQTLRPKYRLMRNQVSDDFVYPKVAIIVPFYNEPFENMLESLTAIEQLDYPGEAVFYLVDDGSVNDCPAQVKHWLTGNRKWQYRLKSLAQNTGAKGRAMDKVLPMLDKSVDVVGVIDSDTCLEPQALTRTITALYSRDSHAAACGFIVPANPQRSLLHFMQYFEHIGMLASVKNAQNQFGLVNVMAGAFVLHKVEAIEKLGGWGDWLVEDISWTWKAIASGYTMAYAHDAVAHTVCPSTTKSLFNQRRRWARGRIEALRVAWNISKTKTLSMVPWLVMYFQASLIPGLILMPLSFYLDFTALTQYLIGANLLLLASLNLFAFIGSKKSLQLRKRDFPKSLFLSFFVDLLFMPANVIGMSDEIRKKDHHQRSEQFAFYYPYH